MVMKKVKICLLAGHSSRDGGAVTTPGGVSEHALALRVLGGIMAELDEMGYDVEVTERERAGGTTPLYSALAANATGADVAVELHFNSADAAGAQGAEWLYYGPSSKGADAAAEMLSTWCRLTGVRSRGVLPVYGSSAGRAGRFTTRGWNAFLKSRMPFFMAEPFFGSNPQEASRMLAMVDTGAYARAMARAIAAGVRVLFKG